MRTFMICTPNNMWMIKLGRMRWVEHVAYVGKKGCIFSLEFTELLSWNKMYSVSRK
jgi:hypothetical protein